MNKKIVSIVLISIFLLAMVPSIAFAEEDRSYTIDKADIQLFVQSDGLLHVKESLFYSFDGEWNGVYRDIPLKEGQSLKNIKVTTKGAYSFYEIYTEGDIKKIKIYLYSDPGKTKKISDRDVEVIIEYDFVNLINMYNDVGELHYKIWGEDWNVGVEEVTSSIHFNSSAKDVKFWLNPLYLASENSTSNSTINLKTDYISSGDYFEIRAAIPLSNFENPVYANKINRDGLAEMEKIQKEYVDDLIFKETFGSIIAIILAISSIIIPVYIYLKYGREPKIQYYAEYEREPPTNDPPAFVNALSGVSSIGNPNADGFQATIMDLINRNFLSIVPKETEDESLKIKFNDFDKGELNEFELDIINFLKSNLDTHGNFVDLKKLTDDLHSIDFRNVLSRWENDLKDQFLDETTFKKYFINKGSLMFRKYGIVLTVLSPITMCLVPLFGFVFPVGWWNLFWGLLITLIVGIVCACLPYRIGGRWTECGKEYDAKWKNFKKYLNDFSLMKEYPPESVAVWNHYLVYATALGVADKVEEAMKIHLPAEAIGRNSVYYYRRHGGYAVMSTGLSSAMKTGSSSSSGGSGSVGGGSGGGGGGAF